MKSFVGVIAEESKVVLANGEVIEGAEQVAMLILNCCEAYADLIEVHEIIRELNKKA